MTQKKLEIIGLYTPEHEGPYLFNGEEFLVHGTLGTQAFISRPGSDKGFIANTFDIRNAREVPVAREFWINEYHGGGRSVYLTKEESEKYTACLQRTIHVREVLPGEGA